MKIVVDIAILLYTYSYVARYGIQTYYVSTYRIVTVTVTSQSDVNINIPKSNELYLGRD